MEQYDVVFVGFPIWWYVAPTIINTFLEVMILRKTSFHLLLPEAAAWEKTNERLAPSCPGATLLKGKMLNGPLTQESLKAWSQSV